MYLYFTAGPSIPNFLLLGRAGPRLLQELMNASFSLPLTVGSCWATKGHNLLGGEVWGSPLGTWGSKMNFFLKLPMLWNHPGPLQNWGNCPLFPLELQCHMGTKRHCIGISSRNSFSCQYLSLGISVWVVISPSGHAATSPTTVSSLLNQTWVLPRRLLFPNVNHLPTGPTLSVHQTNSCVWISVDYIVYAILYQIILQSASTIFWLVMKTERLWTSTTELRIFERLLCLDYLSGFPWKFLLFLLPTGFYW